MDIGAIVKMTLYCEKHSKREHWCCMVEHLPLSLNTRTIPMLSNSNKKLNLSDGKHEETDIYNSKIYIIN